MKEWLVKPAILKPTEWGFHDTGQRCRQTLASGSMVYFCPSFLTPTAKACNSLVLIEVGKRWPAQSGKRAWERVPQPNMPRPLFSSLLSLPFPGLRPLPWAFPSCVPKAPAHSPALVAGIPAGRTNYPDLVLCSWNFSVFLIKTGSFLGMQEPKK